MHYLDHAATTPLLPEVQEAMAESLALDFGNPSSLHGLGRRARRAVEDARERVAAAIGASPAEVVFTGGGTEADNLALKGAADKRRGQGDHVVTTSFEHHAVLDSAKWLARAGLRVTHVAPGGDGVVDVGAVADALERATVCVSVMSVNNEIGTVQPVADIAEAVRAVNEGAVVHTDAVQALGNIPVDVAAWGVDLAAFAAHKLGGPKGVGALFVRSHTPLEPLLHGGGQERGLRSGTLNVPGIVGFGVAAEIAAKEVHEKTERLLELRRKLWEGITASIPDVSLNGDWHRRVAGNLNFCVGGAEGETLLLLLDQAGIACSSGSACASGALDPSHVLLAIGVERARAEGSLRMTLGRASTLADVEGVVEVLPGIVDQARRVA
jgi:cysteine desulfurase